MLKVKPLFKEMIWGGNRLKSEFNFNIPSIHTGEAWVVSAHAEGSNQIVYQDQSFSLNDFYSENRKLFGKGENKIFPLMVKIIDAAKDLSIQVHPNDDYALIHENSYGKNESWYILNCPQNHRIVMGHNAKTKEELARKLQTNDVSTLFREVTINPGDCFDVSAGTIHAICEGTLVYEVQQNSNITYRIFDYNRLGLDGNPRELHIQKSIDVATVPSTPMKIQPKIIKKGTSEYTELVSNDYFDFSKINLVDHVTIEKSDYFMILGVENGDGIINNEIVKKGDHFIVLPHELPITINGNMSLFVVSPKEKSMM